MFCLFACSAGAQQAPKNQKMVKAKVKSKKPKPTTAKPAAATQPVITFGRTPCLGRCPHFTARIFPDGRVQYEGFEHAPVQGKHDVKMPVASIERILREADKIGFRKLKAEYSSGASDMPSTTLSIRYPNGTTKAVRAEDGTPEALQRLYTLVNTEVEKALGVLAER
ncbi:DUF6438 domain-containing protein [Hymenobacter seoulensis]